MKSKLIIPFVVIIASIALILCGDFSWRNFLIGALFALSAREVGEEVLRYAARR